MKLFQRLPETLTVDGKRYRVDLDFRNVLRLVDILGRADLLPASREYLALKCVMKRPPHNTAPVLAALRDLLFPPEETKGHSSPNAPKLTDYAQDADLIRAAFLQAYGINLWRDKLHWFEFSALLANLPEGTRYADVISIRARPMPEPTKHNAKERQWLMEAKARYALRMTPEEEESRLQASLHATTQSLLALAKRGSDKQHG
jgi:hypothetical protein